MTLVFVFHTTVCPYDHYSHTRTHRKRITINSTYTQTVVYYINSQITVHTHTQNRRQMKDQTPLVYGNMEGCNEEDTSALATVLQEMRRK